MKLRRATEDDIEEVMRVFAQARLAQRRAGFRQWEDGYPSVDVLKSDIADNVGFILDDGGMTAGYIAIATRDDEYDRHSELWFPCECYAVFHRISISDDYRGKGLSGLLFDLAEAEARDSGADYIRIDTGLENKPMQHILSKRGYTAHGSCNFIWGPRLAYDKPLTTG